MNIKYTITVLFLLSSSLLMAQTNFNKIGISKNNVTLKGGNVVINELMASNDTAVADQDGEFDDWAELFNLSSNTVDLSGYFLSDDPDDLMKWQFPEGTSIGGDSYLIIWVDDDEEQEGLHTPFKLSAAGESLHLIAPNGSIMDEVVFDEQTTDLSYARQPNGTGDFVIKAHTFNANNNSTSHLNDFKVNAIGLNVFPSPATHQLTVELKKSAKNKWFFELYNLMGKLVLQDYFYASKVQLDVSSLRAGLYIMKVNHQYVTKIAVK